MTEGLLMDIMKTTISTAACICAPLIITILVVGFTSQVLQSITQLKDQSLSFVPKVFATGLVFVLAIPWYIQLLQQYANTIFTLIEKAAR